MGLGTTPTTVLCLGAMAETIGTTAAAHLAVRSLPCQPQFWMIRDVRPGLEATRIGRGASGERWIGSHEDVVTRIVAARLTVGHIPTAQAMEEPVAVRVSVIVSMDDADALPPLTSALRRAAESHVGTRHLREAYLVLPRRPTPDATERLRSMLNARSVDVTLCWWLGHVDTRGLTLPDSESAADDLAAVIAAALSLPPHKLPLWDMPAATLPIHLAAGCGELAASAAAVSTCVVDRHVARLIRDLLLEGRGQVDRRALRRRIWAIVSTRCQSAIDRVHETPGGEQIWNGLRLTVPDEVAQGTIRGLLADVEAAQAQFDDDSHDRGLASCRQKFEVSAEARVGEILGVIDAELDRLAQLGPGRLFDAVAWLEELATVLSSPADEGEQPTNIQHIRQRHDALMAAAVRLTLPSAAESAARVRALQLEYTGLEYLRTIMRPPALPADIFGGIELDRHSIDRRLAVVGRDLDQARRRWAQSTADAEAELVRGLPAAYQAEKDSRSEAIGKAGTDLRAARGAWEGAVLRLNEFDRLRNRWLRSGFRGRAALEGAGSRAHAAMMSAARNLIAAAEAWARLRIDATVHEVRRSVVVRALEHVHRLHSRLTSTLADLERAELQLRDAAPPGDERLLHRPIIAHDDVSLLANQFTPAADRPTAAFGEVSLLAVALSPSDAIIGRLREYSASVHSSLRASGVESLLRFCHRSTAWLSEVCAWMRAVSAPRVPTSYAQAIDSVVVCGCADSPLGRMLTSTFPEAIWVEEADGPSVLVVGIRRFVHTEDAPLPVSTARDPAPVAAEALNETPSPGTHRTSGV